MDDAVDGDERGELGDEGLDARDEGAEGGDGLGVDDGGGRGEAGREDPADALGAGREGGCELVGVNAKGQSTEEELT